MKNNRFKLGLYFFIGAMTMFIVLFFLNSGDFKDLTGSGAPEVTATDISSTTISVPEKGEVVDIASLTREELVISYVKEHGALPSYYLTKSQARSKGWVASEGNLCEVLPGQAIGGDIFSNREKKLPRENTYLEADVNYNCGRRGAERIVFTKKGEVWLTKDHYKTFSKQ